MSTVPSAYKDLLEKKAFASLATVNADGTPQVTPVWFDWDGRQIRINTAKGRIKDKNLRSRPAVALAIMDPDNPYRYLQIRGRVASVTETDADAHIDSLANRGGSGAARCRARPSRHGGERGLPPAGGRRQRGGYRARGGAVRVRGRVAARGRARAAGGSNGRPGRERGGDRALRRDPAPLRGTRRLSARGAGQGHP